MGLGTLWSCRWLDGGKRLSTGQPHLDGSSPTPPNCIKKNRYQKVSVLFMAKVRSVNAMHSHKAGCTILLQAVKEIPA